MNGNETALVRPYLVAQEEQAGPEGSGPKGSGPKEQSEAARQGSGGRQRLRCALADGHDGDHHDASGRTWPQRPNPAPHVAECEAMPPGPSTLARLRLLGHDGPHRNITDRTWADPGDLAGPGDAFGPCEMFGSPHGPHGPHATVTEAATGRHQQLCQLCAHNSRPAARPCGCA